MKTDLQKILSISGEQGLWQFVSQAKNGIIAESMLNGKRKSFGIQAKVTSLADISIYTSDEEMPLRNVLLKMKEHLGDAEAPAAKSPDGVLVGFFSEVLPEYDRDRFYVSHMKKVVQWYNQIKAYANFDFVNPDDGQEAESEEAASAEEEKKD